MDRRAVIATLITALLLVSSVIPAHAWFIYHKRAFRGKVIDTETKAPIEGAVVVAVYNKTSAGPVESYDNVINVKETLTDKHGEFSIPSYTTVIQPLAWSSRVDFIIFKPGYGSFPHWRIQPPRGMQVDFDEYFSVDLGVEKEVWFRELGKAGAELQRIRVTFGLVELPRMKTREERLRAIPARPTGYGLQDLPLLFRAANEERRRFGLREETK